MGKKVAKQLGQNNEFIYVGTGTYLGKVDNYDISIKYDNSSLLYNMNLTVTGPQNIEKLNSKLTKIDKYAIARYKNNNLTITEACDKLKNMPDLINTVLKLLIKYLKDNKYQNVCKTCGKINNTALISIDGVVSYACNTCYNNALKEYQKEINDNKKIKENVLLGALGAIIGSIPGIIIFFLLSYLKINSSFAGLIIMLGSAYGYKWLANSMKEAGLIISLIIGFFSIALANEITNAYTLYIEYNSMYSINLFDAYKAVPYYLNNSVSFKSAYTESLIVAVIFGAFGGLSNIGLYRKFTANNKVKKVGVKNA